MHPEACHEVTSVLEEPRNLREGRTLGAGLQDTDSFASVPPRLSQTSSTVGAPSAIFLASHFQAVVLQEWTDGVAELSNNITDNFGMHLPKSLFLPREIKTRESFEVCLMSPSQLN